MQPSERGMTDSSEAAMLEVEQLRKELETSHRAENEWIRQCDHARAESARLKKAAKRVLEADMAGRRDIDALNELEDAAGFHQQDGT